MVSWSFVAPILLVGESAPQIAVTTNASFRGIGTGLQRLHS